MVIPTSRNFFRVIRPLSSYITPQNGLTKAIKTTIWIILKTPLESWDYFEKMSKNGDDSYNCFLGVLFFSLRYEKESKVKFTLRKLRASMREWKWRKWRWEMEPWLPKELKSLRPTSINSDTPNAVALRAKVPTLCRFAMLCTITKLSTNPSFWFIFITIKSQVRLYIYIAVFHLVVFCLLDDSPF